MIKCLLMKNETILISEINEIDVEIGEPNCQLINPYQVIGNEMKVWPSVTDQRSIMVSSDNILTIVDPKLELLEQYKNLIK